MDFHDHSSATSNIKIAFFLNLFFAIFEIVGSFFTNSLAVLSTGLHDLGDSFSLGISFFLQNYSKKGRDKGFSYGYRRFSLLAAIINSIVIITGSFFVIAEAIKRIQNPVHSDAPGMILFAIIGITVNLIAAFRVSKGKSLNEKVIIWHLLDDVFGWIAVLIISCIIIFWDLHILDPALSILVSAFILWNVLKNFRKTIKVFLQGVPDSINVNELEKEILKLPHVKAIHDTHLWSLDGEYNILTTHIIIAKKISSETTLSVKCKIKEHIQSKNIQHSTIEIESEGEACKIDEH